MLRAKAKEIHSWRICKHYDIGQYGQEYINFRKFIFTNILLFFFSVPSKIFIVGWLFCWFTLEIAEARAWDTQTTSYWFSGRQILLVYLIFIKVLHACYMFRRNHLYKLFVICVGLKSLGPSHHLKYISLYVLVWVCVCVFVAIAVCQIQFCFSIWLYCYCFLHYCSVTINFRWKLAFIMDSWTWKCFEFKWKSPMAKNNTLQNTTKYFTSGTKKNLWSYCKYTIYVHICCERVCICLHFHRDEENELPDQIAKVVCCVLVCYNCESTQKDTE